MPSWTNNLTDRSTPSGPGGVALADAPNRIIAAVIDFVILGIIGFIVNMLTTAVLGDQFTFLGVASGRYPSLLSSIASVIEVFANGRACITARVYPSRPDSLGVQLFARGGTARPRSLDVWEMDSI